MGGSVWLQTKLEYRGTWLAQDRQASRMAGEDANLPRDVQLHLRLSPAKLDQSGLCIALHLASVAGCM
jgi:hypothetical protein